MATYRIPYILCVIKINNTNGGNSVDYGHDRLSKKKSESAGIVIIVWFIMGEFGREKLIRSC